MQIVRSNYYHFGITRIIKPEEKNCMREEVDSHNDGLTVLSVSFSERPVSIQNQGNGFGSLAGLERCWIVCEPSLS